MHNKCKNGIFVMVAFTPTEAQCMLQHQGSNNDAKNNWCIKGMKIDPGGNITKRGRAKREYQQHPCQQHTSQAQRIPSFKTQRRTLRRSRDAIAEQSQHSCNTTTAQPQLNTLRKKCCASVAATFCAQRCGLAVQHSLQAALCATTAVTSPSS